MRHRSSLAAVLIATVTAGLLNAGTAPARAEAKPDVPTPVAREKPVVAGNFKARPRPALPAVPTRLPVAAWPKAAAAELPASGAPADLGGLKIAAKAGRVRAEVLDQSRARAAGVGGVLLNVVAERAAEVRIDYSTMANVYGGDYGARLRLVRTTDGTEVPAVNDAEARTLRATVPATSASGVLLALAADDTSSQGSYSATSMSASSQWSVSPNTGAFTWSYPFRVPPVPGGLQPEVALSYSSQAVDGKTSATNNQSSWVGEGFEYASGFVERSYRSCDDDGHKDVGDLCWARNAVSISLGGRAGTLVQDDVSGAWRIAQDDGSRVEHLTDATIANGDNDGEYWRVTTNDGTQYWFGRNRLPGWSSGKTETNSTWAVPVYGDDTDEPCKADTFAASHCDQAWRWNLDYVVDPRGNVMSYFYEKEKNSYAFAGKTDVNGRQYDRGGYLKYIDYGQRAGEVYSGGLAPARISFTPAERCIVSAAACAKDKLTKDTAVNWPDTPFDRNCNVDTKCSTQQKAPSFWTRIRLVEVTTQIKASATGYSDVEKWRIDHSFTDNGDGSRSLWPYQIRRTGLAGTELPLPVTSLGPLLLENRLDDRDNKPDNLSPLVRPRLASLDTESGAHTFVDYADPECTPTSYPAVGKSTKRCFPVKWTPSGYQEPITDWFHKYVVEETSVSDPVAGTDQMITRYEYLGGAGWRYAAADGVTLDKFRTWNDWRGYEHVKITGGDGVTMRTRSDSYFLRGLHGDKDPDGGTRTVTVEDSTGKTYTDRDEYAGLPLETILYNGAAIVRKEITEPWSEETATDQYVKGTTKYDWGSLHAWAARSLVTRGYIAKDTGGWREMKATQSFDAKAGRVTRLDDQGDLATTADDRCTTTSYADDETRWMRTYASQVVTVGVACGKTADPVTQTISQERTYYDNSDVLGALPSAGDVTKNTALSESTATADTFVTVSAKTYDAMHRVLTETDAEGAVTKRGYATTNGLTTRIETTNHLNQVTVVTYAPQWGLPIQETDANSKATVNAYDSLGRVVKVWFADRRTTVDPSIKYEYGMTRDAATYVRTDRIGNDGGYRTEFQIFDGLLRPRQTQQPGPDGGRLVTDTFYTATGQVKRKNDGYYAAGAPSAVLLDEDEIRNGEVAGQQIFQYDGADRMTVEIYAVAGDEKWRTTTRYGGDRVHVDPPLGGTPTTRLQDVQGHTTELWQAKDRARSGYDKIKYGYTTSGQLKSVQDAAGNDWSFTYDLLGRKLTADDPDAGASEFKYDKAGRLTWMKTGRGDHLFTTYDKLGRRTAIYLGDNASGTKLAGWTYDQYHKGQLSYSQRFEGTSTYSIAYPLRDYAYRPLTTRYIVPTGEGKLAGTYDFTATFNPDGTQQGSSSPVTGDLPAESLVYGYDDLQRRTTVTGSLSTYLTGSLTNHTGAPTQLSMSTGAKTMAELTMEYEKGTGRLKRATTKSRVDGALTPQTDLRYEHDQAGNILSIDDAPEGGRHEKQCFTYDYLQRLTGAWASDTSAQDCSVAPAADTTLNGPAPYWSSYTYDEAGSRQQEIAHDVDGDEDVLLRYVYPEASQQKTLTAVETTTADGQKSTREYKYDAGGNTIQRPGATATQTLSWTAEGRLKQIDEGGRKTSYVYDADGNRLLRKQTDANTLYLPTTELKLTLATNTVTATRYYDLGAGAVAIRSAAGVGFTIGDHQGTAAVAVDAATGAAQRKRTTPFGGARGAAPGTWPSSRGFVGGLVDEPEGLTHLGARDYDPVIGRFVSPDPVVDYLRSQQIHGYTYSDNNPVTMSDPSGENPWEAMYGIVQAGLKAYYDAGGKVNGSSSDHDVAVRVRVANLRRNYPNAHIKFDYKNKYQGADIICYDCSPDAVWVWEVKPVGSESAAANQVNDIRDKLQENLRYRTIGKQEQVRVVRGPVGAFKPIDEYAIASNGHNEVLKVTSAADGVEIYEVHKGRDEPDEAAFRLQRETNKIASEEETRFQEENFERTRWGPKDAGAVTSDPAADALVIGPIALGAAACILYCGPAAVGAGARWLWRAIKPDQQPAMRRGDWDLAG
ncbi:hypothetical protein JIG36_33075 [Actinoplanes sp. LDG1-06]|uniref:Teneurin-like YD-shell domain-containing protein n=1 Tax=Paractinoplanes ovalisporus TaxID=2810368 RepID=A0ABS2AKI3_9ACTN|nr:RHS repeat-associated core domain-containing protein [Actinoplanes ovalisporus]MBM2620355.1 hypothetical protein [Actinoplanes ovalisporus]